MLFPHRAGFIFHVRTSKAVLKIDRPFSAVIIDHSQTPQDQSIEIDPAILFRASVTF
jgi:hypothetical protein